MTNRTMLALAFLNGTDWAGATTAPLAGDASNRRYLRVRRGNATAVPVEMHRHDAPGGLAVYHALGVLQNLRIREVFARLCHRDGKPHYVDLIPRVWAHLMHDLHRSALAGAAPLIRRALPPPTQSFRQDMKSRCSHHQTR